MKISLDQLPDAWLCQASGTRDHMRNLSARAQAFIERIAHLSADLESHGRTCALALQKLRRIRQAKVRRLKDSYA
jgi:hypothetical protein